MRPPASSCFTLAVLLCWPAAALAHIGGLPSRPEFTAPAEIVEAEGDALPITWIDDDSDPTGVFVFRFQAANSPPFIQPPHPRLAGNAIAEIPVSEGSNRTEWPLADAPAGAWHVWAVTDDPPWCMATFAPALVIIRGEDGVAPLGALVTRPAGFGDLFDDTAIMEFSAVSPEPPTLTVRAGVFTADFNDALPTPDPDAGTPVFDAGFVPMASGCDLEPVDDPPDIVLALTAVENVPMEVDPSGPDRYRARVEWDVRDVPRGDYVIEAKVQAAGQTAIAYGSALMTVYHPGGDPRPTATPDDGGLPTYEPPKRDDGCAQGLPAGGAALLGFVLLALRRRS